MELNEFKSKIIPSKKLIYSALTHTYKQVIVENIIEIVLPCGVLRIITKGLLGLFRRYFIAPQSAVVSKYIRILNQLICIRRDSI